jgi:hypothetical protein
MSTCPDFSSIDFETCDIKGMSSIAKQKVVTFAKKINPYQEAAMELVMIVLIVHHLAIIYNAQRAVDLVSVTDSCNAKATNEITATAKNMIWVSRIGAILCTVMLIISRLLTVSKGQTGHIVQAVFGVLSLAIFIITVVYSTSMSTITTAVVAADKGHCGGANAIPSPTTAKDQGALGELQFAINAGTGWSAVGIVASLLYTAWYVFRIVTKSGISMMGAYQALENSQ